MIRAVIFDMDGLLIDSEPFWQEAEAQTFNEIGIPLTKQDVTQTMGFRVDEVVAYWYRRYPWQGATKKEIGAKIVERVIALVKQKGEPLKGVRETVTLLANRNIPLAIASSSLVEIIEAVLDKIELKPSFQVVYSAENEPYGKPHPGVFITTAEKLGVSPELCLVFEDSPNGVIAAKAARMQCIAVPTPAVKDDKRFCIADMIIPSLEAFRLEHLAQLA